MLFITAVTVLPLANPSDFNYNRKNVRPTRPIDHVISAFEMNLLFVCSENRLRSPTAEEVFSSYENINAIGAGTNADSETPVSGDLIEWADWVFVMERSHKNKVSKKYRSLLRDKKLICLGIPDNYDRMQPELIQSLVRKVSHYIEIKTHD